MKPKQIPTPLALVGTDIDKVFWLPALSTPCAFPIEQWHKSRFRPRLQRRDRNGFAPFSLTALLFIERTSNKRMKNQYLLLPDGSKFCEKT